MSDFIRTLNLIKTRRDSSWLTPSQQEALALLREVLRVPGPVNLFGSVGVGKTFLAWNLTDILGYTYFPHPTHLEPVEQLNVAGVVIDNAQSGRQAHRGVLKALSFRDVKYAVLITRRPIQDYSHYVELNLTSIDQAKVRDNLASIGLFRPATDVSNLWFLVNPYM